MFEVISNVATILAYIGAVSFGILTVVFIVGGIITSLRAEKLENENFTFSGFLSRCTEEQLTEMENQFRNIKESRKSQKGV